MAPSVDVPTVSVSLQGHVGGSTPWYSTMWWRVDPRYPLQGATAAAANSANTGLDALWTPLSTFNTADTTIEGVTARGYEAGASASSATVIANLPNVLTGSSVIGAPLSQCVVATLRTATQNRSGRGRLYLPATAGFAASAHGFPGVQCGNLAQAVRVMYLRVGAAIGNQSGSGVPAGPDAIGVVRSLTHSTTYPLIRVDVDSRPDRQEHREAHAAFGVGHSDAF